MFDFSSVFNQYETNYLICIHIYSDRLIIDQDMPSKWHLKIDGAHGVKVFLYFLYSPVFQAHILYFRGKEKFLYFA